MKMLIPCLFYKLIQKKNQRRKLCAGSHDSSFVFFILRTDAERVGIAASCPYCALGSLPLYLERMQSHTHFKS
jgi:hypothetical protein